jgi:hypothetical protein
VDGCVRAGWLMLLVLRFACVLFLFFWRATPLSYRERMKTIARSTKHIRVLCLIIQKQVGITRSRD